MKAFIGITVIACLLSTSAIAQSTTPTRIHFLNLIVGINTPEVKTTLNPDKSILIKARTWVTIETVGDSLGLLIDGKPYFVHFAPNKQYYFVLNSSYTSRAVISEKTEQEFMLTASIDNVKGPEVYSLGKVPN
jgi:hypothetical protein